MRYIQILIIPPEGEGLIQSSLIGDCIDLF